MLYILEFKNNMNLFENIFDKFTKQAQPMPSFGTPQAPRTNSYVAPNIPYSEQNTGTGFWSITQPKPINTSLPMWIPEPVFQKDPSDELKKEFWFNDTDIEFLRQAKQEWYDSDMAFEYITKKKEQEKQNIYSWDPSVDNTFMNVVWWAIAEIPKVAWEVGSFLWKASQYMPANLLWTALEAWFTDKTYWQLREEQKAQAEQLATAWQAGKEFVQKYGAYNPKSTGANVWETITDIGSAFVWPNKAKILKEWTGFVKWILPKTLNLATEWALAWAKYDVATKGEITEEWVWYGAGWNLVFGAWAKLLWKWYNALTSKLPASITLGGLINPWKLDVVKKSLQMDEWIATPEDVGKWILDRVKPWNKQQIAEQLIQHAEKTKWAVDEALASIPTYYKNPEAKKALLQIRNELEWKVWLEGKLAKIDEMLAKPDYTLSELNAVKRELDDMYNLYTKTGDPTAWLKAEWLRNVRANIRWFIEDEAEKLWVNVRKLNNETSTARGLADGILRKDSADWVRELLTAFAPSGAGAVVWAGQAIARWEDPLTIMRDALIGGVATKLGTSTTVRTRIASALNKLVPKELTALENYIKSGGKDAIGKKVAEKVIREGRALPSRTITKPSDFANPTEKSIITPQTMEKWIIQESKQWLSPNIKRQNGNTNNTTSNSSNIPIWSKKVQEPIVKPNSKPNAKQPRSIVKPSTKSDSDIPEGYFKNAFWEIVKNPSNSKGGFIRNPFAKPEPKRLFAGENSAQPPKWKTGWFKWADGKMRFEIDDSGAKFYDNAKVNKSWKALLWDIFRHDELFNQYPETKSIIVKFNDTVEKWGGNYNPSTRTLTINWLELDPRTWEFLWWTKEAKSTLLHEIQHAIQEKEWFAKGGSIEWKLFWQEAVKEINRKIESAKENIAFYDKIWNSYEKNTSENNLSKLYKIKEELISNPDSGLSYKWQQTYERIAWEVEARNVQSRMNLTAKERTLKSPESTEDVPRDKQIIRMDGKWPSMSIKVPEKKIVKPVEKTVKAISNEELDALTKKATELGKYDGSYDVTKWKKLYRGWSEDGVFWTDDIDIAKSFWDEWVAEKIITMKKPLDVRSKDIREYIKKNTDINIDDATSAYSRSLPEFKKLMKWAKENWYDWIIGKTSDNWLNFTWNEFVTLSPPKPLSQQKTVKPKNLTEWKQSIGDMETKKLIELPEIFKLRIKAHNSYERDFNDISSLGKLGDIIKDKQFKDIADMNINIGWVWEDIAWGFRPSKNEIFLNKDILKYMTDKDVIETIYEEAIHALRSKKWRNVKYTTSYLDQDFEKSAKKWAKFFSK